MNPRQLATDVIAKLDVSEWCEKVEIAGAGFLNFRLSAVLLSKPCWKRLPPATPVLPKDREPKTVVVDFSSPNVAKPMHVGHIRSTVLGDALAQRYDCSVIESSPTIILAIGALSSGCSWWAGKPSWTRKAAADPLGELERIYKFISSRCDPEKPGFDQPTLDRARAELVSLQAGDPENLGIWTEMIRISQPQFDTVYQRLGVSFDHTLGESFYNRRLPGVVDN